jgi:Methyltransferase domain
MSEFEERNCPGCGAAKNQADLEVAADIRAEELSFDSLLSYWRGFRSKNVFFSYWRCRICRLLYCPTYFSGDQLSVLYSFMEDNTFGEEHGTLARTQRSYVKALERVGIEGLWLDVGADIGLCSQEILGFELVSRVDAVEPNTAVYSQLRSSLGADGLVFDVIPDSVGDFYNGAIAVHVLDHLTDLDGQMLKIRSLLREGGIFSAVVHNEASFLRRAMRKKWPPFCLQHPQIFSATTLAATLERHGFHVISVRRTVNWFSLRHLAKVVISLVGLPKQLGVVFPTIPAPIPLGNIQIIASKPEGRGNF